MDDRPKCRPVRRALLAAYGTALATLAASIAAQDQAPEVRETIRIDVTGSNIKRTESEGALPLQVITRDEIARSGIQTAQELVERISANQSFGGSNAALGIGNLITGYTAASLRGLGSERTLVLLNGHRLAPYALSGGDAVDMQARVEPQFLFNTLAQVRKLHAIDAMLAEAMLDELIAYLRAAMPKMRDPSSTLGQEIDLVRSYLAIVRLRMGGRLTFSIDTPHDLADIRMPPMMLLPLVDHAVVRELERVRGEAALDIRSAADGDRLRLLIRDSGAGFVAEAGSDGIAALRERLYALYGDGARLVLDRNGERGTQALMELPLERPS